MAEKNIALSPYGYYPSRRSSHWQQFFIRFVAKLIIVGLVAAFLTLPGCAKTNNSSKNAYVGASIGVTLSQELIKVLGVGALTDAVETGITVLYRV